jgi:hypothetical protein
MKERVVAWFPFVLALLLPVAGLVYGFARIASGDRDGGLRIIGVAVIAAIAQGLIFL